jgi:hypothetical protein
MTHEELIASFRFDVIETPANIQLIFMAKYVREDSDSWLPSMLPHSVSIQEILEEQ